MVLSFGNHFIHCEWHFYSLHFRQRVFNSLCEVCCWTVSSRNMFWYPDGRNAVLLELVSGRIFPLHAVDLILQCTWVRAIAKQGFPNPMLYINWSVFLNHACGLVRLSFSFLWVGKKWVTKLHAKCWSTVVLYILHLQPNLTWSGMRPGTLGFCLPV